MQFEVGDIVRLRGNKAQQRVTHVGDGVISTKYLKSENYYFDRNQSDFVKLSRNEKPVTLFQTPDGKYGKPIATNSDNRTVLELEGGGYADYDPKYLKKVLPYTIEVRTTGGKLMHVKAPKDKFKKGDLIVHGDCQLVRVMAINTETETDTVLTDDAQKVVLK